MAAWEGVETLGGLFATGDDAAVGGGLSGTGLVGMIGRESLRVTTRAESDPSPQDLLGEAIHSFTRASEPGECAYLFMTGLASRR